MVKMKKKFVIVLAIVVCLVVCFFFIYNNEESDTEYNFINYISILISNIIASISAFFIYLQLRETQKIQEAEFLINLNQSFVTNAEYAKMYTELESCRESKKNPNLTRVEISNYLTFFETIYLLIENKVVSIEILDDLFEYRFFLAVHNKTVQEMKLVKNPHNFRNIYFLEKEWINYRKSKSLIVESEKNCLEAACKRAGKGQIYNDIIGKKESTNRFMKK